MMTREASVEPQWEAFEKARLIASDYDMTQFDTFDPPPGGVGVNEAYAMAIGKVLGPNALYHYQETGHNNRTPAEIVQSLLGSADGHFLEKLLIRHEDGASTAELVDYSEHFSHPHITQGWIDSSDEFLKIFTDIVVATKLAPMLRQIGQKLDDDSFWPRPIEGFLEFARTAKQVREDGIPLNTAVVSAGHTPFIKRTYALYDLESPDIFVTDELVRDIAPGYPAERRAKPAPLPIALTKRGWLELYNISPSTLRDPTIIDSINARIKYIGDSKEKDGGLAQIGHVDFIWIDPTSPRLAWQALQGYIKELTI